MRTWKSHPAATTTGKSGAPLPARARWKTKPWPNRARPFRSQAGKLTAARASWRRCANKAAATAAIASPVSCGKKAFAAGTDISQFRSFKTPEDGLGYEQRVDEILSAIEACRVPVIAAMAGACTGGGAAIAACCDIRLASRDMRYGYPIARTLGNCLSARTLQRMIGIVGGARVTEMLFTSRLLTAQDCLAAGLVTEILSDHSVLMTRARSLAAEIAGYAPLTISTTKQLMRRIRDAAPKIDDHDLVAQIYTSADFREGLDAFLTKRPPVWTGT